METGSLNSQNNAEGCGSAEDELCANDWPSRVVGGRVAPARGPRGRETVPPRTIHLQAVMPVELAPLA
jgi:hypothetical protein